MIIVLNSISKKNSLHEFEYIRPICDILEEEGFNFRVIHISEFSESDLLESSLVIISGNSLRDNEFLKSDFKLPYFLKNVKIPIIGVCAGAMILALLYGGESYEEIAIGSKKVEILEEDFRIGILKSEIYEVYSLRSKGIRLDKKFRILGVSDLGPEIFKLDNKYGFLFHIEVRNRNFLRNFLKSLSQNL